MRNISGVYKNRFRSRERKAGLPNIRILRLVREDVACDLFGLEFHMSVRASNRNRWASKQPSGVPLSH